MKNNTVSPSPEEMKKYGYALAALKYGILVSVDKYGILVGADEDGGLLLVPRDYTVEWYWQLNVIKGTDPIGMLAAAAAALGLEPVALSASPIEKKGDAASERDFRNVVGVILKEMETHLEVEPETAQQALGHAMIRRWIRIISAASTPQEKEDK